MKSIKLLLLFVILTGCSYNVKAPIAKKIKFEYEKHGYTIEDPYRWLHDKDNPEVVQYIKDENAYAVSKMKSTKTLQKDIYNEIISRMNENEETLPVKRDQYYYYFRDVEGQNYSLYCRKFQSLDSEEEILFNPNIEAENYDFYDIGFYDISPNHKRLAYSIDTDGSERYTLWIKDLETGKIGKYAEEVEDFSWSLNNIDFLYTTVNDQFRSYKLFRHLGKNPAKDELIYHEEDAQFYISIYKSRDKKYFILDRFCTNENESFVLPTNNITGTFERFIPIQKDISYTLNHHGNSFYMLTNENAKNSKFVRIMNMKTKEYEEILPHREDASLNYVSIFEDYFVFQERENATLRLKIYDVHSNDIYTIPTSTPFYNIYLGSNPDYKTSEFRFVRESFFTPYEICSMNVKTKEITILKKTKRPNYDATLYDVKRVEVPAHDGKKIPLTLLFKKGSKEPMPTLITSYGAYGDSEDPYFSSSRISLLDRGIMIAIPHIRGGSDKGEQWYDDGKMLNKKNTFYDFNACSEYLLQEKISSKLVASGGSAGGMLMGAIANMRPELYAGIVADVPFVDVLNTMLDPTLPLTVGEYQEWGNPEEKKYFDYIRSYSPYDNVKAQNYPHILAVAGWNDARVSYWEAAKWVAKLREYRTNDNLLLLYTNMNAGHGGDAGRYDFIHEIAFNYAFIIKVLAK
jgi:oligopeptidase B